MRDLVDRLRAHALPDPHDEREVMHAPLLREAADEIERLRNELAWPSEARLDVIGQNGNTGEHYRVGYAGPTANWGRSTRRDEPTGGT